MEPDTQNFGQTSNGRVCSCGRHHGLGQWSPGQRAATYARQRDRLPNYFTPMQQQYLASFEYYHGPVKYELRETHKSSGTYLPKDLPVREAFCLSYHDSHDKPIELARSSWADVD